MDANAGIYMDTEAVQGIANGFRSASDTLSAVSTGLEAAIAILQATAFLGMIGNAALAHYLEGIKPHVDRLSQKCGEIETDLYAAIAAYINGDYSGSTHFG